MTSSAAEARAGEHETVGGVVSIDVMARDADGAPCRYTLVVDVVDDMPLLAFDRTGAADAAGMLDEANGYAMAGELLLTHGADRPAGGDALSIAYSFQKSSLDGGAAVPLAENGTRGLDVVFDADGKAVVNTELGVLVLTRVAEADGTTTIRYEYQAKSGHGGDFERFTFTVTDNDGDSASVVLHAAVRETITLDINSLGTAVYEGGLDDAGSQVYNGADISRALCF